MPVDTMDKVLSSVQSDPHLVSRSELTQDVDPDAPLETLIEQRKKTVQDEGDAFLRDGFILMCLRKAFSCNGTYKPTNEGFQRFLDDAELGIGAAAATQRIVVYSKFCDYDEHILTLVKAMGVNRAFICAKVKTLDYSNVEEVCRIALSCNNTGELALKLKDRIELKGSNASAAAADHRLLGRMQEKERRTKITMESNAITVLHNNPNCDLIGDLIFVPRWKPLFDFNGIKHQKFHETAMALIFNSARQKLNPDEMMARMVYGLFDKLPVDQQNRITKDLKERYGRIEPDFNVKALETQ